MSEWLSPLVHGYSCLLYSRIFMVQFYIHEYSRYKTEIIHEYSRIYTMNINELFMFMKAGQFWIKIFLNYCCLLDYKCLPASEALA